MAQLKHLFKPIKIGSMTVKNRFLAEVAEKKGIEIHIIGDASGVDHEDQGTVWAAIAAGYDTGTSDLMESS